MDNTQHTIDQQSLYQTPNSSIVLKNFLVGFSRGLGNIFAQLIFLALMYVAFIWFVLPQLTPYISMLEEATQSLQNVQKMQSDFEQESNSNNLNDLLLQFQNGQTTR